MPRTHIATTCRTEHANWLVMPKLILIAISNDLHSASSGEQGNEQTGKPFEVTLFALARPESKQVNAFLSDNSWRRVSDSSLTCHIWVYTVQ